MPDFQQFHMPSLLLVTSGFYNLCGSVVSKNHFDLDLLLPSLWIQVRSLTPGMCQTGGHVTSWLASVLLPLTWLRLMRTASISTSMSLAPGLHQSHCLSSSGSLEEPLCLVRGLP